MVRCFMRLDSYSQVNGGVKVSLGGVAEGHRGWVSKLARWQGVRAKLAGGRWTRGQVGKGMRLVTGVRF